MRWLWLPVAVPLFLAAGAVAVGRFEPLRQVLLPPERAGEAKLRKVIPDLRIDATSLAEALEQLGQQGGARITYRPADPNSDADSGVDPASLHLNFELRNVTLGEALDVVMRPFLEGAVDYTSNGDGVLVTPAKIPAAGPAVLRVYDVSNLDPSTRQFFETRPDPAVLYLYSAAVPRIRRARYVEDAVGAELAVFGGKPTVKSIGGYVVVTGTAREQVEAARITAALQSFGRDNRVRP